MNNSVGNVILNYDYYNGCDYYSDGQIEDDMLDFVKSHSDMDYHEFVEKKRSWAGLYHLSPIRQNIVSGMDISKDDNVLEIGAGCGAVTGRLCEMANKVTCIELSQKRSLINAYRNKDKDNLSIIIGNFQDIVNGINEKYDVVTLIGVYEYAMSYIDDADPYHSFLEIIKSITKPGGRIIIAIENRLGMKYFAGCKEDHVGLYFEGIEGYTRTDNVRTFSKPELETILSDVGLSQFKFYYPYPDYKFPVSIFTDEHLPGKGDLNMNVVNIDQDRQILFDESKAYDSIVGTGLFPIFSNSFLIEIINQ